ncbi:hypothetical protein RM545_06130 [Zunongwangia sp. F260]|uniref:Glycosyltransferase n=1 Tax=Autumnicola lenta TaxID=3075593 RepID=A0ABU3CIZ4_9FLAO|nr:hypothetical protein [Zunongwangia sp. F260]MDT0646261.1 hypothetical protein [Zunongwangia sp. F260]
MNLQASLSYRLVPVYEKLVQLKFSSVLKKEYGHSNKFELRFFCGKNQATLLKYSLLSILKADKKLPHIQIFSDGSLTEDHLPLPILEKFNGYSLVELPELMMEFHSRKYLMMYSHLPMIKKYMVLFYKSKYEYVVYADTDILWFSSIQEMVNEMGENKLTMCYDYMYGYDEQLLEACSWKDMKKKPPLNAGVVIIKNNFANGVGFAEKILQKSQVEGGHWTEQTMIARQVLDLKSEIIPEKRIMCSVKDKYHLFPIKNMYKKLGARHFVTPVRHLFWRDLFWKI